jgi:PII-like signaling protein
MDLPLSLTIEQEFQLNVYTSQAKHLSEEQVQELLIEMIRQNMIKDNLVKHFIKKSGV